jgi:hypothetical protein
MGRSKDSDFVPLSSACSGNHAILIEGGDDSFILIDKESSNGTRVVVNGVLQNIKQVLLGFDDQFYLGDCCLTPAEVLRSLSSRKRSSSNYTTIRDATDGSLKKRKR